MENQDFLTDAEKGLIAVFNESVEMKAAVQKVMLQYIYDQGVLKKNKKHSFLNNWALVSIMETPDDLILGQKLRAKAEALRFLNDAFGKIGEYKKVGESVEKTNNAK